MMLKQMNVLYLYSEDLITRSKKEPFHNIEIHSFKDLEAIQKCDLAIYKSDNGGQKIIKSRY